MSVLLLRTCSADGSSHNGFRWPLEVGATVEAPDWNPRAECGGGLHGLLWGEGDGSLLNWADDAKWIVVEADDVVAIDSAKVKARSVVVRHVGDRLSATTYLVANGAAGKAVVGALITAGDDGTAAAGYGGTATAGDRGTATAGYGGTAAAGYGGTATAGDRGTATAGDRGTATAGDRGTAAAGYGGTAAAGDYGTAAAGYYGTAAAGYGGTAAAGYGGTATAGYYGTAAAGDGGTATAGDGGTATAGYGGTAAAGYYGTAAAGDGGTATAGDYGTLLLRWWDNALSACRITVGYVGEGGIKANTKYRLNDKHEMEEVK